MILMLNIIETISIQNDNPLVYLMFYKFMKLQLRRVTQSHVENSIEILLSLMGTLLKYKHGDLN